MRAAGVGSSPRDGGSRAAPGVVVALLLLASALSGCLTESEWALGITGIQALRDRGLTGKGVKIAIIDTGIDLAHPQFHDLRIVWRDFVHGRSQAYDDNPVGHGTHVAGIIGAQGDLAGELLNGVRVRGAAPGASLIVAKAVHGNGEGTDDDVAAAVDFAVQQGADVLCLSLGGTSGRLRIVGTATETAVQRAIEAGVVVVAAAGNKADPNEPNDDVATPASVEGVLAVGAADKQKRAAPFSFQGDNAGRTGGILLQDPTARRDPNKKPELLAPGVQIVSAARDGRYAIADGTSQATPFVAAAIALMLEAKPQFQREGNRGGTSQAVQEIKAALAEGAEKVGPLAGRSAYAHDDLYGYGLLRADDALDRL